MIFIIVILGLAVLVLIHELGHFLVAKLLGMKVEEFGVGFPPRLFKKKIGGTLYSLNLLPFGGFVRLFGEDEAAAGIADGGISKEKEKGFNDESAGRKGLVIVAGVFMNVILGWLLLSLVFMVGMPRHLIIADVASDSPASIAGLQSGDIVKTASGDGVQLNDPISAEGFTGLVKENGAGSVSLEIERSGKSLTFNLSPRLNPPQGQGPVGVNIAEMGFDAQPIFGSFVSGFLTTWETVKLIFEGLIVLIGQLFSPSQTVQGITGPVGIVIMAAQTTSLGFIYFIQLLALISINLAVLNLLPFPALDGGRFFFLIIEKIINRPISRVVQNWVNGAGFAALILLMVFVTVKDISRLL